MKVEFRKLEATYAEFVISEVDHAFVNSLRRALIADVPRLAIDEVTIYDNTSALFDEMVAHRLGLLPVPTDPDAFNFRDACTCGGEGCPSCTVLFTLSKEGPGTVYSGDLTPADPRFAIPDPKVPIVKLLEGQRVMLEAAAVLGRTGQHAKWQSIVAAAYQEFPVVNVKDVALAPNVAEALEAVAPTAWVRIEDNRIKVLDAEKAAPWLKSVAYKFGLTNVEVKHDPSRFIFRMETDGSLHTKVALAHAARLLMDKLKTVEAGAPELTLAA